jgi:hypothetical protein
MDTPEGKVCTKKRTQKYHFHLLISPFAQMMELSSTDVNFIDFGLVQVNDRAVKSLSINNASKFPFDFKWDYQKNPALIITPGENLCLPSCAAKSLIFH